MDRIYLLLFLIARLVCCSGSLKWPSKGLSKAIWTCHLEFEASLIESYELFSGNSLSLMHIVNSLHPT